MALRGIQEYIARVEDEDDIVSIRGQYILVSPEKEPPNIIIIIIICVILLSYDRE